ncbi:MAG: hypothetical protein ACI9S9_004891 [Planctomycetota bacterium]|jgi:hypothetical protein
MFLDYNPETLRPVNLGPVRMEPPLIFAERKLR